ncbi:MAG: MgtC/SapB family protein [Gammaproteobacteria bacterium]
MGQWQEQLLLVGQIALAMALGGAVGWEREMANKAAGFRTHMLVAGAAALFVGIGLLLNADFLARFPDRGFSADPIRILQAVMIGVGFLVAGTIFRPSGNRVGGLTSAATILLVSGVGMACALSHYILALCTTVLTLIVLRIILLFERRSSKSPKGSRH